MMSFLAFGVSLLLLTGEGWLAASRMVSGRSLRFALALPLAALINALLFLLLTVLRIPLVAFSLWIGHLCVFLALALIVHFFPAPHDDARAPVRPWTLPPSLRLFCLFILGSALLYGFFHSSVLPPFQYDSFTNWLMRSKLSWLEQHLVFDNAFPHEAIRKPFYPFLVHGFHILANTGQETWRDGMAGFMTFLLSTSLLASAFLLLKRTVGFSLALLTVTVIVSIPLFAMHMGEGYADHLLAEQALVSLAAFVCAERGCLRRGILLSGLLAAAAVWTKAEGLFFVFLPWLLLVLLAVSLKRLRAFDGVSAVLVSLVVAGLWPLFVLLKGFAFTPHGSSDFTIGWHPEAFPAMLRVFFAGGSFGPFWAMFLIALCTLFLAERRRLPWSLFLPGILSLATVIGIYAFTSNVTYLLNGESFDRQLLTPAALLIVPVVLAFAARREQL